MIKTEIKRVWLLADLHFGVRTNSLEWLEIHKDYFYNFFIPMLKEKKKEGDALFVLGDIFESRQSLNIRVLNEAINIFIELSKIIPIYVIVGNHDSFARNSLDINSLIVFKNIDNITIFDNPDVLETQFGQKLLMMPWIESKEEELKCLNSNQADYLFCHTDFQGIMFNKKVEIEEGLELKAVSKFKKVYSGHIHLSQKNKNVFMIGCIFPLTRNDLGDTKKIVILDFETGKETIINNNYSPKFLKYTIDGLLERTFENFEKEIQNNFVDIIIDSTWTTKFPFSNLMDSVSGYKKLNYILSTLQRDGDGDEFDEDVVDGEMDIEDLTEFYIQNLNYSEDFKKLLLETSTKLYKKGVKYLEEKTIEID